MLKRKSVVPVLLDRWRRWLQVLINPFGVDLSLGRCPGFLLGGAPIMRLMRRFSVGYGPRDRAAAASPPARTAGSYHRKRHHPPVCGRADAFGRFFQRLLGHT